jgi:hypothetical protein
LGEAKLQMETILREQQATNGSSSQDPASPELVAAWQALQSSLRSLQELWMEVLERDATSGTDTDTANVSLQEEPAAVVSVEWLLHLCASVPSHNLEPWQLAQVVVDVAHLTDEVQQQTTLLDAFGTEAMDALIEITSQLSVIRETIEPQDLQPYISAASHAPSEYERGANSSMDLEEQRRQLLLQEALDTAQVAEFAQAQVDAANMGGGPGTHTVVRTSDVQLRKLAEKAKKRAAQAIQRAIDAGVILNAADLMAVNLQPQLGEGGLLNRSREEILALQQSLLPEGTREYYDQRGLPKDAIHEKVGDMERVIIPASLRDDTALPKRLRIVDIMDPQPALAFEGTSSLNPMQSATFDVAFHSRDNMMVCAPVRFIVCSTNPMIPPEHFLIGVFCTT